MRRVVITGLGAVTPIGNTVKDTWQGILENRCGIEKIPFFDTTEYKAKYAGIVKDLDIEKYFSKREINFNDMFTIYARITAKQALIDSKLDLEKIDKNRLGVLIASGIGGIKTIEEMHVKLQDRGPSRISPYFIPMVLINLASGRVAIDLGAHGYTSCAVTACAASTNGIGDAFRQIRDGYLDIIFAGGTEASITPLTVGGFQAARALYTGDDKNRASIPFDKERGGFVMAEGSATLVLEDLEHAKKRGAHIYAEIVGYGASCDAHHITSPSPGGEGAILAMQNALDDAKIKPEEIDYINAHGTSTALNDKTETLAVKKVFKEHAYKLKMSSTKSNTGHLLGATGAVEAVITALAIENGHIPPTINYKVLDEECDLNIVPNKGIDETINYAMSTSLGFGGHNASIILKKWEE